MAYLSRAFLTAVFAALASFVAFRYFSHPLPSTQLSATLSTTPQDTMSAAQVSRSVVKSILARVRPRPVSCAFSTHASGPALQETPEGAGAVVRRSIGTAALRNFTPFLMLDNVSPCCHLLCISHRGALLRGQRLLTFRICALDSSWSKKAPA